MIRALVATALLIGLTGCATSEQLNATNKKLDEVTRQLVVSNQQQLQYMAQIAKEQELAKKTPGPGCFLDGKLFSPGSVVAGRVCRDVRMIIVSDEPPRWGWSVNI